MKREKIISWVFVFFVIAINLSFGWPRLIPYSAVDEPYWTYDRTPDFWRAIEKRKWKNTQINDKPGITTAIISGAGILAIDPMPYKSIRQETKSEQEVKIYEKINFSFRLPIYLTCLTFLIIFFLLLRKLFNDSIAILSVIFIGLSPIILGISLIINPDSLLWAFIPFSIVSYLTYQKENKKTYLALTGIFLGFSLLTKYVANILYVYFLGLLFLGYFYSLREKKSFYDYLKNSFLDYFILVAVSLGTFFAFFPAAWVKPEVLLGGTILSDAFKDTWPLYLGILAAIGAEFLILKSRFSGFVMKKLAEYKNYFKKIIGGIMILGIVFVFYNVYSGMKIFDFVAEMASPKGGSDYTVADFSNIITSDLYALLFALTPFVLTFFCYAIFKNMISKKTDENESSTVFYFLFFIIFYYIASTAEHVTATVRYQIVVYPLAGIIAAIGFYQFINSERVRKYLNRYLAYSLAIIISYLSLYFISPYFFTYASVLLPQKYVLNLKDMGDGSYEAARYLNSLPNAKNFIIWTDKGGVCETFVGHCITGFRENDIAGVNFDYFVVSTGRKSRSGKMYYGSVFKESLDFDKLYSADHPGVFEVKIGGRSENFVKVEKTEDIKK